MQVERLEIVSAFRRDPAVFLAKGPQLRALAKRYKGEILNVNTPEYAPPELPRFVLRFDRAVFQVALNRYQFVVEPPAHVAEVYAESMSFAANLARPVVESLFEGATPEFQWTGVVSSLNFPIHTGLATAMEAAGPLFRRLTTLDWDSDQLATFELKVGRRHGGFFRNYAISGYDLREIDIRVPTGARGIEVNLSSTPVREVGVTVAIDVNSRPAPQSNSPTGDLDRTLQDHHEAYTNLEMDLNLSGVL